MPLSPPAARERLHTRTITCHGYQRADGLFDIEGHITDVKTTPVPNEWRRDIPPGVPIHEMWARLTLDKDMLVVSAEAASDHTPYEICPAVAPSFAALAGLRIGPGWRKLVKETVGGTKGCTHIVELIGVRHRRLSDPLAGARQGVQVEPDDAPAHSRHLPRAALRRSGGEALFPHPLCRRREASLVRTVSTLMETVSYRRHSGR